MTETHERFPEVLLCHLQDSLVSLSASLSTHFRSVSEKLCHPIFVHDECQCGQKVAAVFIFPYLHSKSSRAHDKKYVVPIARISSTWIVKSITTCPDSTHT